MPNQSQPVEHTPLELAERCEKAEGPDRLLDANIHVRVKPEDFDSDDPLPKDYCYGRGGWTLNRADCYFLDTVGVPRYTASFDAALTLVPENCAGEPLDRNLERRNLGNGLIEHRCWLSDSLNGDRYTGFGVNDALALSAAALRARGGQ